MSGRDCSKSCASSSERTPTHPTSMQDLRHARVIISTTMQAVRPENVVLEVCRSRTAVIYDQELLAGGPGHAAQSNSMSLR